MTDKAMAVSVPPSKVEHITHRPEDFHSWVPEISLKIHKHFRIRKIIVEVDGNTTGEVVQMIYERGNIPPIKATGICPKCETVEVQLYPVDKNDMVIRTGGDRTGGADLLPDYYSKKIARMICGRCVRG